MAEPPSRAKIKKPKKVPITEIEMNEGAWERLEALVISAAKMGHQAHGPTKPTTKRKADTER